MIKILRVSNHPSRKRHGVGLHPHKISETDSFETIFVSPLLDVNDPYLEPEKYTLKVSEVKFKKRPVKGSLIVLLLFHFSRIYKLVKFSFFCIKLARKNKVDIVHIHSPMYLLVAIWGKITGKLTCITYHGTDYLRVKDRKLYSFFSKAIITIGFCISPHMIEKMKKNHKQVEYTPNGVDTSIFINKMNKRERMMLAVGSLKKEKSYNNLIRAFKKVVNIFPDYVLHIAGDGALKGELYSIVKEESIENNVHFCGNLNKQELVDKYNTAESFILSSYSEGFPKVVLEAIFCGCKVVATDVGSVSTFLPSKYLIPNDSIDNLYKYMVEIIGEDIYEINTDQLKSKFTWSNVIHNYERAYTNNLK